MEERESRKRVLGWVGRNDEASKANKAGEATKCPEGESLVLPLVFPSKNVLGLGKSP